MEYREYMPDERLAPYVECYWSALSDKPPFRAEESLIPDGTIELMFNFGDAYQQVLQDGYSKVNGAHFIGIRKHALTISQTGKQNFFCIRFRPGGTYPFFRIPAHLFANGFFGVRELLGKDMDILEEQLYEAEDNNARVHLANSFLLKKYTHSLKEYNLVKAFIPQMKAEVPIASLAREYGSNYKALERAFNTVIGLTPREYRKIQRFNSAVLAMYSCRYDSLTSIAHASHYYDQAHFIRDFKQLTGFRPKDFLKEQFTIVQVIQPALAERMSKSYNFQ